MSSRNQVNTGGRSAPARTRRRATLQDIAREVDVSVSLVSKVLNRQIKGRTPATRAKMQAILDKARELDYQQNASARSLVKGLQGTVAVYVHDHGVRGSEITSRTIKGLAEQAARLGQRLLLQYYSQREEFDELIGRAHRSAIDGLALIGIGVSRYGEAVDQLLRRRMPVVTVYDQQVHPTFPNIGIDQRQVARVAAAHLIERGCRHVAFIGNPGVGGRLEGYRRALADAGLPFDERRVAPVRSYDVHAGEEAVLIWRRYDVPFDGVVCQSDPQAAGVINQLGRHGVRVPQDVKVVGIDDSPFCEFHAVPISSVAQMSYERGSLAADALDQLSRGEPVAGVVVEPRLCARASTGG